MKGHMEDGKFHPHTPYKKGVRKSRDQKAKTQGVKVRKKKEPFPVVKSDVATQGSLVQMARADVGRRKHDVSASEIIQREHELLDKGIPEEEVHEILKGEFDGMSNHKRMEWENVVDSEVVKVKHEMINGMPVTTVRFANGEEWFEFDKIDHQDKFMMENDMHKIEHEEGEFVKVDHPMISGFITMPSGKVLFGEREDKRDEVRMKRTQFKVGDIVKVSPDNDNEGYDSFRGKKLRVVHVATSTDEHQGFDEGLEGEALYDFETLDGEPIGSSLYDYELVKA